MSFAIAFFSMDSGGIVWHSKLYNDSLTPKTTKIFHRRSSTSTESTGSFDTTELWTDSPWPARNNVCFTSLNSFMERCNDVLELVQTTQHFEMLTCAAKVGGAGGNSLDSQVREIHAKFLEAVRSFQQMPNVRLYRQLIEQTFKLRQCNHIYQLKHLSME